MDITRNHARGAAPRALRIVAVLAAAIVVAVAVNAAIAWIAAGLGAPAGYGPLSLPAQTLFTVIGVGIGWVGWRIVQLRAHDPGRVLRVLVPVVVLVSLVPDVLLLVFPVIPGTNAQAMVALMLMHVVVAACAVPAYVLASRGAPGIRGKAVPADVA